MMRFAAIVAIVVGFAQLGTAQIFDATKIVKWTSEVKAVSGTEYDLVFTANIDKGWHLYSQTVGKGGPVPTSISLKSGAKASGKAKEESAFKKEALDPNFNMKVTQFENKVSFTQRVKGTAGADAKGEIEFMICNHERCLPPAQFPFSIKLKGADKPKKK